MNLYILVSFWFLVASIVFSIVETVFSDWPKITTRSLPFQVTGILEKIAWAAWAGILLWIK